jgi:hypothetical protein
VPSPQKEIRGHALHDEIDALRGESLRSVLRQLRDGHRTRPADFPASVVLCGLRDVRDYQAASGGDPDRLGTASPFNIKVASLRMGDFTEDEVAALYAQHTDETGQPFTEAALARAFDYTRGQPWLVNALAREVTEELGIAPPAPITPEHVDQAKERLILARATHLESLAARLAEPRVRRVIAPLIAEGGQARVANPIYREVIVRVLGAGTDGGGHIDREYGVGRGRIDLLVRWPYRGAGGRREWQPPLPERTRFSEAHTPSGRSVTLLQA